jgi:hypothetical protein
MHTLPVYVAMDRFNEVGIRVSGIPSVERDETALPADSGEEKPTRPLIIHPVFPKKINLV